MTLDSLHLAARRSIWLQRLAAVSRILLATGFIPTGMVKVLNRRFTTLPGGDDPIGRFFEALYQTGGYWQFLGWAQVVSGVLLLIPRTAPLGAICFLPIMTNIFVITIALHFTGTTLITGLMLLAVVFLVLWDFHRWKRVLFSSPAHEPSLLPPLRWQRSERVVLTVGTLAGLVVFTVLRGLFPAEVFMPALITGALAALALLVVWIGQELRR